MATSTEDTNQAIAHVSPESEPAVTTRSWRDMTRTITHYDRLEQIGEGTYGQVYRARCLDSGRIVAMKKMRIISRYINGIPPQLIREIKILKQLRHPNLLSMIEVVTSKGVEHLDPDDPVTTGEHKKKSKKEEDEDPIALARERYKGNLFLVLEYVTHDLTGLMDVSYQFTPVQIKCIFEQLLKALKYMHAHKLVHRDIKSSNILIDSHFRLKLADFGLARSLEPPLLDRVEVNSSSSMNDLTNKVITLWYRSPEILLGTVHYGYGVDVWSAGCILFELLTNKPLATGKSEMEQLNLVANLTGTPDEDTWAHLFSLKKTKSIDEAIPVVAKKWSQSERKTSKLRDKLCNKRGVDPVSVNLLEKLLEWDPRKRLTAANALENKYFWSQPVVPKKPEDLGRLEVAEDGHFHEFQTKPKRREAKQKAELAKEEAVAGGASADDAANIYDETYQGIMKQVAQEGFKKQPVSEGTSLKDRSNAESQGPGNADEKKSEEKRSSSSRHRSRPESEDESDRRRKKKRRREEESGRESKRRSSATDRSRRSDEDRKERRPRKDEDSVEVRRREERHRLRDSRGRDMEDSSERRRKRKKEHRRHKSSKSERRHRDYDRDEYWEEEHRAGRPGRDVYPPERQEMGGRNHHGEPGIISPREPGIHAPRDSDRRSLGGRLEPRRGPDVAPRNGPPRRDVEDRRDFASRREPGNVPRIVESFPRRGEDGPRRGHDDRDHRRRDRPRRDYDEPPRNDRDGPYPRGPDGPPLRRDDRAPWRDRDERPPRRDMDRPEERPPRRDMDRPPPNDGRRDWRDRDELPPRPLQDYPPQRDERYDRNPQGDRPRRPPYYDEGRRGERRGR